MVEEMKVKEGYKQTEIGVIPVDWNVNTLDNIGTFKKGKGIARKELATEGVPCVLYGDIYTKYNYTTDKLFSFISKKIATKSTEIFKGDVLFAGSGETIEDIGKSFAYLGEETAYAGGDIIIMSPYNCDPIFLGYVTNSPKINQQKSKLGQGSSVIHIYSSNLKRIQIPEPPLAEQQAIATALSDIDNLITSLEKLIDKKQKIKQGTMQQLLTGKKRLPGFAGEWIKVTLSDIGSFESGSGFPTRFQGEKNEEIPFYKVSDMNNLGNNRFMFKANNYIKDNVRKLIGAKIIPANSIVFAKIGAAVFLERKRILSRDGCIDNNMMAFTCNNFKCDYSYIYLIFKNIRLSDYANITALPSLSSKEIGLIEVRIPNSIKEQKAITSIISDMDSEIEALEKKLIKYKTIKQGMMQELLTGRIRLV